MAETTFTDTIDLDFGVPVEKEVDGEFNPLCREEPTWEDFEGFSTEKLIEIHKIRQGLGEKRQDEPTKYGWTIERWRAIMKEWKEYDAHVIYGGNRSSKSTFAARVCIFLCDVIPGARVRCWSINEQSSINDQQAMIYEALSAEHKKIAKSGKNTGMKYSDKNGFTGNKLVFPTKPGEPASIIYFQNYKSYALDSQVAEGWKAHFIWLDEEAPQTLFQTMRKRLWDYRGKMFLTFTTLKGWTALIHNLNSGAENVVRRYADKAKPPRMVPYEQISASEDSTKIWYFWTEDNVFIPTEDAIKQVSVRPDDEIMSRLYGVCTKAIGLKFPKFKRSVHVIKEEDLPWRKFDEMLVTRYQTLDPAGRKNWFWLYFGVVRSLDEDMPNVYVYDEFPDLTNYGEWGLTSEDPAGKAGPAQENLGHGVISYVDIMRGMEGGAEIFEYGIDKRYATSNRTGMEGNTRLLDDILRAGIRYVTPTTKRVDGRTETELGCQVINDYLNYDENRELDSTNVPHLYFTENCGNTIMCLENYTGEGGPEEVWKDPVDCLRIFFDLEPRVIDWDVTRPQRARRRAY